MASWHATSTLQEAREACGGEGFRWSARIAHRKADSDIFTTFEGDNTVLQLQVAKGLLAGYRQEFSDMNAWGLRPLPPRARRPSAWARSTRWPAATRTATTWWTRPGTATCSSAASGCCWSRSRPGSSGGIDKGMDSFDAFVEVQDHLLTLASAHAERFVLESFQDAIEAVEDDQQRTLLGLLCALYALEHIEADRGWFLEQNLIDAPVAKAVRTEVNSLLHRLRPVAVELVDAFGIPDELLGSEIGSGRMPLDP